MKIAKWKLGSGWITCALVAIGVGPYLFSGPRNGTIDYHKERIAELSGRGTTGWRKVLWKITGIRILWASDAIKREKQINWHMERLRQLGFWEQRDYVFTNRVPTPELIQVGATELVNKPSVPNTPFYFFVFYGWTNSKGSNVFSVKVPRTDIARWEALVSKLDVPEK